MSDVSSSNSPNQLKLLLGITGSVASIQLPLLCQKLIETGKFSEIRIVPTQKSLKFLTPSQLSSITSDERINLFTDEDEWDVWKKRGDPVTHIDLVKWANCMLIAPLDANTLAKIAHGLCDNLLTCIIRAWDFNKKLVFCPAMNTKMWDHPITREQIEKLETWGFVQIKPIEKLLMCGDRGIGAMAEVDSIVAELFKHI